MDSSHCVSVLRERGHGLFSSLYSPCWGNSSNIENEGASTKYTWLTLQNEINNPAAPIYRRWLGLTKHWCLNGAFTGGAMSHAFRGEADSLRQHHTNYCLLKENLQAHCLYWYDWTKFPYFCPQQPKEPLCWFCFISWTGSRWEESFIFF